MGVKTTNWNFWTNKLSSSGFVIRKSKQPENQNFGAKIQIVSKTYQYEISDIIFGAKIQILEISQLENKKFRFCNFWTKNENQIKLETFQRILAPKIQIISAYRKPPAKFGRFATHSPFEHFVNTKNTLNTHVCSLTLSYECYFTTMYACVKAAVLRPILPYHRCVIHHKNVTHSLFFKPKQENR